MDNKPSKYGMKILVVCDVATKYVTNATPYLGKCNRTNGITLAEHFVAILTKPSHGSGRNVTIDS